MFAMTLYYEIYNTLYAYIVEISSPFFPVFCMQTNDTANSTTMCVPPRVFYSLVLERTRPRRRQTTPIELSRMLGDSERTATSKITSKLLQDNILETKKHRQRSIKLQTASQQKRIHLLCDAQHHAEIISGIHLLKATPLPTAWRNH